MKVIFGLGNPGRTYRNNRHNVGYMILDIFAENEGLKFKNDKKLEALTASLLIEREAVVLAKPLTFMNNSGVSAAKICKEYGLETKDLLVVYDDADLEIGALRFRLSGSSAGHRGLASIIERLATPEIRRLKIGIGRPGGSEEYRDRENNESNLASYVLEDFSKSDLSYIGQTLPKAVCACRDWVTRGDEYVMKNYNKRGGNSGHNV